MPASQPAFVVVHTPAFSSLAKEYEKQHRQLAADIEWLDEKLRLSPETMGERVPQLQNLALPIYKTRCKDSCHNIGQSGGWRIYYAIKKDAQKVFLLFLHHKKEYEKPRLDFLIQKLEKSFATGLEQLAEE
jgi:mRNA-degrading endonuclease RelE of RelBE toxin-antitoxin system